MGIIMGYHHFYLISTSTALMLRLRRLRLVPVALHMVPPGSLNKRLEPRIRESVNHHVNHEYVGKLFTSFSGKFYLLHIILQCCR